MWSKIIVASTVVLTVALSSVNAEPTHSGSIVVSACGNQAYIVESIRVDTQDTAGRRCGTAAITVGGSPVTAMNPVPVSPPASGMLQVDQSVVANTATTALAANLIAKAAGGGLYDIDISADATLAAAPWWVMVYDSATVPADGVVRPARCYAMPLGSISFSVAFRAPLKFGSGIVVGVSTTGCFTKTESAHAFIAASYR